MGNKGITSRENFPQWYNDIVVKAGLAESSEVRGCMIIKPYGYAIWEKMQAVLDKKFKDTGHSNAYFPLLIPKSYFSKEADHVEGFAKECAVVTHYRLKNDENGKGLVVDPDAKLEEELIIRPTSETIIWNTFRGWIQSYRDLPLLINQWVNVVRWEMRTRLFLRTSEFLWQEGHTAHATKNEAIEETEKILNIYADFAENWMAIPVIKGVKTPAERFAGAVDTYCIEGLMQDGKALQMGTSHFLGQNFSEAFNIKFKNKEGKDQYVWQTCYGPAISRILASIISNHGDDKGLIIPYCISPIQVTIIPIFNKKNKNKIIKESEKIKKMLDNLGIKSEIDSSEKRPGEKYHELELKGIPFRIELGDREIKNKKLTLFTRDIGKKQVINMKDLSKIKNLGLEFDERLKAKANNFLKKSIVNCKTKQEIKTALENKKIART
ncbi:MAG: proline--tRNA ligase, partial [Bacteroidetes bacterium]|nr:proline--tRNA ligase [Bacteroidota bacterium]